MRRLISFAGLAVLLAFATPAAAQRPVEFGIDAGAIFGLGDESSISITVPASRFRVGFPLGGRWYIEPVAGFSYNKVEGVDGVFTYNLELGALYHVTPFTVIREGREPIRVTSVYLRPFVGLTGYFAGDDDDTEFSIGAGVGVKIPWLERLAWRLEANLGYGFDNEAARIGLLAGLSFFPR